MTKHIKRLTYHNFMTVINKIMAKGYTLEEAEPVARNIFAEFESRPLGISIETRVERILTKEEWLKENAN